MKSGFFVSYDMKKISLIGHLCEVLDLVRQLKHPADNVVREFFRARHYLGSKDRRFISETLYTILRNYKLLHRFASSVMDKVAPPDVPSLAIYAVYALKIENESLESILTDIEPAWQIAFPGTDCKAFLNGVSAADILHEIESDAVQRIALKYSFPDSIISEWVDRFGENEASRLCEAMNQPAATTIRVNTLRATVEECQRRLLAEGIDSHRPQLSPFGLVLAKRINVQASKSFKDGLFEMQDEGSQLVSLLLEPKAGQMIVDACAGGGGKTLHIAALMKNEGDVRAVDVDERRFSNIRQRITRAGVTIATLQKADDTTVNNLAAEADAVLVDAPCSGVGTFRRNPAAKLTWSQSTVDRLAKTQHEILQTYSAFVKSGGRLVYSTCTLLRQENENVVVEFLKSHAEFQLVPASESLQKYDIEVESSSPFLTLLPHETDTDGFFAAVLVRRRS